LARGEERLKSLLRIELITFKASEDVNASFFDQHQHKFKQISYQAHFILTRNQRTKAFSTIPDRCSSKYANCYCLVVHDIFTVGSGLFSLTYYTMYSQPKTVSVLNETLIAKVAATTLLLLLMPLSFFLLQCYNYYSKPSNLPVLNLEGWEFEKAKSKYISNVFYYLKLGREKVGSISCCRIMTVTSAGPPGARILQHAQKLISFKFQTQPFLLWGTEGYITILPEQYVEELKSADDSIVNNAPLFKNIVSDYNWYDLSHNQVFRRAIQSHLTPKLSLLMPAITEEVEYALQTELPTSQEWTPFVVNKPLLRIVSLVSGRIFVGPALNRNEEWMNACIDFTLDLFNAGRALRRKSYFGKALAIKLGTIPEVKRVFDHHEVAHRIILPIIHERARLQANGVGAEVPNDMISWVMEEKSSNGHPLPFRKQAELQLIASLAAIHTTTLTTTNLLYDLVARPEYFEPLRQEIDNVWSESDGLDKTSMIKLVKLDSFLKESQRLNPHNQLTFDREIRAKGGLTLSNGVHLKQGARVAVAANQMALDPNIWENPEEFHGFRFAELRSASKEDANKFQFANTSITSSMYFGFGKHDCPGRFFASNEIKTIVAYLIRKYDLKAAPDSEKRPESLKFASRVGVNPNISIMMKEREGGY
jgi:cytochrome P450